MNGTTKQRFRERFDALAAKEGGEYDSSSVRASWVKCREREKFASLAASLRPGTAMDMGCGAGLYGQVLRGLG